MYEEIKTLLENELGARERRYRAKYITRLVLKKHGREYMTIIPVSEFSDMATDYSSYVRMWQMVTKEHTNLRGNDYDDGEAIKQKKQVEMGYEPMFTQDIKKGRQLSFI